MKPTYLYIKQHKLTGKLYFGKTTRKDPVKYIGSGIHWKNHVRKHGKDHIITLWYCLFLEKEELIKFALMCSELWSIVNLADWLNLKPENGIDGGGTIPGTMTGRHHSKESKEKISKAMIGKFIGRKLSDDVNKRIHDAQRGDKSFRFTGYYHTPHGVFGSSREAALSNLSYKTIQLWCKNSNNVISKRSSYFKEEHSGKTLREIGFWFQSL